MRYVLAAAVFMAVLAVDLRPARAYGDAPWCSAVTYGHSVLKHCVYRTFEECVPNILGGNRGFCEQNPDWIGRAVPAEAPRRRYKRRVNRD